MSGQNLSDRALRAQRRSAQRDTTTTTTPTPTMALIRQQKPNGNKRIAAKRGNQESSATSRRCPAQTLKKSRTTEPQDATMVVVTTTAKRYGLRSSYRTRAESTTTDPMGCDLSSSTAATSLDKETTATVTPAAPRRQIDFSETSVRSHPTHDDSDSKNNNADDETMAVPRGVVNVFPSKKGKDAICSCPAQSLRGGSRCCCSSVEQVFVADYGKENLDYLKEREQREFASVATRPKPPTMSVCNSPSTCSMSSTSQETTLQDDDLLITTLLASSSSPPSGGIVDAKFLESTIDHLSKQPHVTPRMRAVLVSWLVEVGVEFNVSDAAFHLAISILDSVFRCGPTKEQYNDYLFLSDYQSGSSFEDSDADDEEESRENRMTPADFFLVKKNELQALGCACAWMGSKLEDKSSPQQEEFSFISDYSVSTSTLRKFEFLVFKQLDFSLQRLTPLHFINPFLRASQACPCRKCEYEHPVLRELVMYLLCLARLPSGLMDQPPSLIAAAALYLARATLNLESSPTKTQSMCNKYWTKTLEHYTGYSLTELRHPVLLIYQYQLQAEQLGVAAYDKFKRESRRKVALITAKRVEDLELPGVLRRYEDLDVIESSEL